MTRFERWFLRRVIAREVTQGYCHFENATDLYRMIRDAWIEEFTEDNEATADECLSECFKASRVMNKEFK